MHNPEFNGFLQFLELLFWIGLPSEDQFGYSGTFQASLDHPPGPDVQDQSIAWLNEDCYRTMVNMFVNAIAYQLFPCALVDPGILFTCNVLIILLLSLIENLQWYTSLSLVKLAEDLYYTFLATLQGQMCKVNRQFNWMSTTTEWCLWMLLHIYTTSFLERLLHYTATIFSMTRETDTHTHTHTHIHKAIVVYMVAGTLYIKSLGALTILLCHFKWAPWDQSNAWLNGCYYI